MACLSLMLGKTGGHKFRGSQIPGVTNSETLPLALGINYYKSFCYLYFMKAAGKTQSVSFWVAGSTMPCSRSDASIWHRKVSTHCDWRSERPSPKGKAKQAWNGHSHATPVPDTADDSAAVAVGVSENGLRIPTRVLPLGEMLASLTPNPGTASATGKPPTVTASSSSLTPSLVLVISVTVTASVESIKPFPRSPLSVSWDSTIGRLLATETDFSKFRKPGWLKMLYLVSLWVPSSDILERKLYAAILRRERYRRLSEAAIFVMQCLSNRCRHLYSFIIDIYMHWTRSIVVQFNLLWALRAAHVLPALASNLLSLATLRFRVDFNRRYIDGKLKTHRCVLRNSVNQPDPIYRLNRWTSVGGMHLSKPFVCSLLLLWTLRDPNKFQPNDNSDGWNRRG